MSYQRIFDQAIGDPPPTTVDLDAVIRRHRRSGRIRPALAAAATAVAVAAGAVTAGQLTGGGAPPAPLTHRLAGFPEYQDGTRVVAAAAAAIAGRSLTLTFTPATLDLVLLARCDPRAPRYQLLAELSVGTVTTELPICPALRPEGWDGWGELWDAAGLAAGEPATITVTLTGARTETGAESALPTRGTFALAVAERVRFEEYPLPSPPSALPGLEVPPARSVMVEVRADPTDPNRRVEREFRWPGPDLDGCDPFGPGSGWVVANSVVQTPGRLRVLVGGVEAVVHESWDYRQRLHSIYLEDLCLRLETGDPVTITVEPEHLTGDWWVALRPSVGLPFDARPGRR